MQTSTFDGNLSSTSWQSTNTVEVQEALVQLGKYLKKINYRFITITPQSHSFVLARTHSDCKHNYISENEILRDFFGWNKPVLKQSLPPIVQSLVSKANAAIEVDSVHVLSRIRFSTVDEALFIHSAHPTSGKDAVFFGPDTYRFIRFLKNKIKAATTIVDLGCGPGTAGIVLFNELNKLNRVEKLYLGDINTLALNFALINILLNEVKHAEVRKSNLLANIPQGADLIIANPPFILDVNQRTYCHGGANYGSQISVDMVQSALSYLKSGGTLALYTGSCIVNGEDIFFQQIQSLLELYPAQFEYEEIDCDIFGEELQQPGYADVDRIAAVSLLIKKY